MPWHDNRVASNGLTAGTSTRNSGHRCANLPHTLRQPNLTSQAASSCCNMRSAKKRSIAELDDNHGPANGFSLLSRIRNMWQFANLCQWIYLFGKAVRIPDDVDIEVLEAECLQPRSTVLRDIGLALLKYISSHRGLTLEIFDEYARRQFVARAPSQNPFGTDEAPVAFDEFNAFTKIRVLQQLTQWAMIHPARIRERMEEQRDIDQASWRIEPYGWDREDRTYFVLDDNRIYRLTEAPLRRSWTKSKKQAKKASRAGSRSSKRQQVTHPSANDPRPSNETEAEEPSAIDDGLDGMKWECVAVTLDEVDRFLQTIQNSRDDNEKILCAQIRDHLVPILEQQEESRRKKALQRERELLNLAKLANAKRSSRIAGRAEQRRLEEQEQEEERRREAEAAARQREETRRRRMEKERESRLMSRERRLKDREARRLRYQEDIAQMSNESKMGGSQKRSSRQLRQAIEQRKQALLELEDGEDWVFDCECGAYGQVDDGTHSIACEKCNVWQHSKCVGISVKEAEHPEFNFTCTSCCRSDEAPKSETTERPESVPPVEDQPGAPLQPDPSRSSPLQIGMVDDTNPLSSNHSAGVIDRVPSATRPSSHESASKPGQSPLATSPLLSGVSAPGQVSMLPGSTAQNSEALLPPPSGGLSPVKLSRSPLCDTPSAPRSSGLNVSSAPTLPLAVHQHIPTPPVKVSPPCSAGQEVLDKPPENLAAEKSS